MQRQTESPSETTTGTDTDIWSRLATNLTVSTSTATLLGQVMSLVAVAIGFLTAGTVIGRDLSPGWGLLFSLVGFGMLIAQAVGGEQFRTGSFAYGWLCALASALGLGLGPVLAEYASAEPGVVTQAVAATALIVTASAAAGFVIGRDLIGWLRPLSYVIFGLVLVSLALFLVGDGGNPLLSLAIAAVSTALILVDFNFLRRHGTEDDVVLLATGIFVSVVNIFLALLNVFGNE